MTCHDINANKVGRSESSHGQLIYRMQPQSRIKWKINDLSGALISWVSGRASHTVKKKGNWRPARKVNFSGLRLDTVSNLDLHASSCIGKRKCIDQINLIKHCTNDGVTKQDVVLLYLHILKMVTIQCIQFYRKNCNYYPQIVTLNWSATILWIRLTISTLPSTGANNIK